MDKSSQSNSKNHETAHSQLILPPYLSPHNAIQHQIDLASWIVLQPLPQPRDGMLIAGSDCSYRKEDHLGYAVIVLVEYPTLKLVEVIHHCASISFPYVPGLLSYRELPLLHQAWLKLTHQPELVVMDGQGLAHPRRLGLACHAGLLWQVPTIGCAKSLLVGTHDFLPEDKGSWVPLIHRNEQVGIVLRTRKGVRPVYVSPGNLADFDSAVEWILRLVTRYRLPEVTRLAHLEVTRLRNEAG